MCLIIAFNAGQEPLRLFALEPVDVCLLSRPSDEHPEGWAELEYTEAPEVEGFEKDGSGVRRVSLAGKWCSKLPGTY